MPGAVRPDGRVDGEGELAGPDSLSSAECCESLTSGCELVDGAGE